MSSTTRQKCVEWFIEQVQDNSEALGYIHRTKSRGVNGADVTISIHEGGADVSLYYLDTYTPGSTLRDIVRKNTAENIATVFVTDHSALPMNETGQTVKLTDFILDQQMFQDGRLYVWNGDSIREVHYRETSLVGQYTLMLGDTIDASGLLIIDVASVADFDNHATTARFSYKKFWQDKDYQWKQTTKDKGWDSAYVNWDDVQQEQKTSQSDGFGGSTWDDWYRYFNEAYQRRVYDDFFYGDNPRNRRTYDQYRNDQAGRYPGSANGSGNSYAVLGLTPSASDTEIRAAYRKLMKKYHPDVSNEPDAAAKSKQINNAYADLKRARGIS